jgi:hypothetical protein
VRARRPAITAHHSTTEMSIRQKATTEPGVSDHFTSVELEEKASTAATIATIPIGTNDGRRSTRRPAGAVVTVMPVSGRRRVR